MFSMYVSALGVWNAIALLSFFTMFQAASVGSNIWLSKWTDDPDINNATIVNTSYYGDLRNKYLGVYGGLGALQGKLNLLSQFKQSSKLFGRVQYTPFVFLTWHLKKYSILYYPIVYLCALFQLCVSCFMLLLLLVQWLKLLAFCTLKCWPTSCDLQWHSLTLRHLDESLIVSHETLKQLTTYCLVWLEVSWTRSLVWSPLFWWLVTRHQYSLALLYRLEYSITSYRSVLPFFFTVINILFI